MLAPLLRRTWAPRGCTPAIKVSEPHSRISAIGAMAISPERRRFSFHWLLLSDNANFHGDSIARFVAHVRRKIRSPLILIWDTIAIHHSKPMNDFIAANRSTLSVKPFPPYAPELNPVDRVWGYVKYNRLPNYCPNTLAELRARLMAEFFRVQTQPKLLRSLFDSTGLTL
ncbi:MAG: transposase [Elusimicrobia bacterium]|nr:transposase [Elusimicrobiota bacterium]